MSSMMMPPGGSDDIDMAAMEQMMGGGMGLSAGMEEDMPMDINGVTEIPVPNFAVPAVLELIEILETEMMSGQMSGGGAPSTGMSGGMPPMM